MITYTIGRYNYSFYYLKNKKSHRLNDRIGDIYFNESIYYELDNKFHRENNQPAYYNEKYHYFSKYLNDEEIIRKRYHYVLH